jgi:hypothetical protein
VNYYRVVQTDPPTLADFTSAAAQGRPARRTDPETQRLWTGISVYGSLRQARDKAFDFPILGRYIVSLDVPDGAPIRPERTTSARGHYTLWGGPADLLACVMATVEITMRP